MNMAPVQTSSVLKFMNKPMVFFFVVWMSLGFCAPLVNEHVGTVWGEDELPTPIHPGPSLASRSVFVKDQVQVGHRASHDSQDFRVRVANIVQSENVSAPNPGSRHAGTGVNYDIAYVRAPRYGNDTNTKWPEVSTPIQMEPGSDLMILHPDGSEEILVEGGDGAIVDPFVSFDAQWIYYSKFHNLHDLGPGPHHAPVDGADIYKIHIETRQVVRLTSQEWTPNTGAAKGVFGSLWGPQSLGYGVFNLGACPLPGGKVIFSSSRNGFLPNKDFTFPNLQLFVMDHDGRNVEPIGHLNLGSALHPTVLMDGRVMFSSYESQGLRDKRLWGLWAIWPDGRKWEPLVSAFEKAAAFHFQTQLSDGSIVIEEYYNKNNNGFGTLLTFPPSPPAGMPPFGDPNPRHVSNPRIQQGYRHNGKPAFQTYPFSPKGLKALTAFTHGKDRSAIKNRMGMWEGKVTHPSGAPNNDMLLVWTPGPANNLKRPTNRPVYDGGLYRLAAGKPIQQAGDLILIKNDPAFNEMQPRAIVTYQEIYGMPEPRRLPWLPNDGTLSKHLPEGTPFGLVGTSSFYKRNTRPGKGSTRFDGLDPFNTSSNDASSNWRTQGGDAGKYSDQDIFSVRIVAMEPTSHRRKGPNYGRKFFNHANERLRILGEIPLRKMDRNGDPILDIDGNPDTSFLAKIPADVPFTFQTLDENGLVLNVSQTWHQVRPGEVRNDCGGCHAHAQRGTPFSSTAAAKPDFEISDLTHSTPLLFKDRSGKTGIKVLASRAVDVEYYRDIKPILERSCVSCHSGEEAAAELVLDDNVLVKGFENTYHRLANDGSAKYGRSPMIKNGQWRQSNASRYIRKFQSRRSLLIWKIFGRRLDGWTNADHPTELVPGDKNTFPQGANPNDGDIDFVGTIMPPPGSKAPPLTENEKMLFARWIDLGAPISSPDADRNDSGWFLDDLRPTLTLSAPRAGMNVQPIQIIRIGAHDYYSGLDLDSLSVEASFPVNGISPGTNLASLFQPMGDHIWRIKLSQPLEALLDGEITVSIKDYQGNQTTLTRHFSVLP